MDQPRTSDSLELANWQQIGLKHMGFFFAEGSLGARVYEYLIRKGESTTSLAELAEATDSTEAKVASEIRGSQYMHQIMQVPFHVEVQDGEVSMYSGAGEKPPLPAIEESAPEVTDPIKETNEDAKFVMTPMPTATPRRIPRTKPKAAPARPVAAKPTPAPQPKPKPKKAAKKSHGNAGTTHPHWHGIRPLPIDEIPKKDYSDQFTPEDIDLWLSKFRLAYVPLDEKDPISPSLPYREALTVMLKRPHTVWTPKQLAADLEVSVEVALEILKDLAKNLWGNNDPYAVKVIGTYNYDQKAVWKEFALVSQRPADPFLVSASNWALGGEGSPY